MANFLSLTKVCVLILVTATQVGFSLGREIMFAVNVKGISISDIDHSNPSVLNFTEILVDPMSEPNYPVYNPLTSTLYFGSESNIFRYSLKNKSLETFISAEAEHYFYAMDIDVTEQRLYFQENDINGSHIEVINLDGTDRKTFMSNVINTAEEIQIDAVNGYLYYSTTGNIIIPAFIARARLDNSVYHDILVNTSLITPRFELDVEAGKMYWCDIVYGNVEQANLDGSNRRIIGSSMRPIQPVVYGDYLYWCDNNGIFYMNIEAGMASQEQIIFYDVLDSYYGLAIGVYDETPECDIECLNGGTCFNADNTNSTCKCRDGFVGPTCKRVVGYCACSLP
ncbi:low-density lipoprotein receptor-related protein 6-like isoform X1 [Anneissia japonica]|uniref:low-density lipoprotein receptor-related protein 6-like isoform X1 n=1 Tax=Anneissia japonica TaxID=1529436 RepID=UPI0014257692|nr:low-density lipoprotein receptor-related protein 6-like isoform X1 [Anneissia japonica]